MKTIMNKKESEMLERVREWWHRQVMKIKKRRADRRESHLMREAERRIQVREWNGDMYICVDDIPLLWEDDLSGAMSDALKSIRDTWVNYHFQEGMSYGR